MHNTRPRPGIRTSIIALIVGATLLSGNCAFADSREVSLDIPAESTASALNDLARQAQLHILFPYDAASHTTTAALKGTYTIEEALTLILVNSGLEVAGTTEDTITLRVVSKPEAAAERPTEVIVTGSHVRGGNPTSPVHTISRKDIEVSGYAQIGDVMRSLPENFAGGQNPGVIAAGATNLANQNISNASTVNLRGLGSDATLVLLNGHRLAADSFYQGSDISGIPLAAVQRIEVVPDGASAIYGSDAVAGVVNFILRKNYSGGEAVARLGDSAQGGGAQRFLSLLQGWSGKSSYLLVNAEIDETDPVLAADRAFASAVPADGNLLQSNKRHSLFVAGGWDINDRSTLLFDGMVSDRTAEGSYHYSTTSAKSDISVYTPNYSSALTFETRLGADWKVRATAATAGSRNSQRFAYPAYGITGVAQYENDTQYAEVTADGTALALPTGDLKMAVGGGYRQEHFASGDEQDVSRHVTYAYVEALAPLVTPSTDRVGLKEVELSLSARTETYSDFGTTTNPRVGLRYVPVDDLTLRATWGTSFKAPSFVQMYDPHTLYIYPGVWLGYSGAGNGFLEWGGNPDLKPERATSKTFGFDYSPAKIRSLKISATWFDIDYTDRVLQPISNYVLGLSDPLYAPFVDWNPSSSTQAALMADVDAVYNSTGAPYDPATIVAILHNRYANASAQTVKGFDLSYRQTVTLAGSRTLNLFANGSWLDLRQKTISTSPETKLSGTIFNAPKFKARGGLSYLDRGLSATGIVNFIASEDDTGVMPTAEIASWTTFDVNLAYDFGAGSGRPGWKVAVIASNLFDKDPPRTVSPASYPGLNFDSTNASIMGRFVSLTVGRSW
ncbi:TonB-dependent receptor [Asticcacaulis taihuensis]|uniref:Outer membrane receptor for ferrienterochelin and colicins n=1 Tax=Asticcacaulis taihuensis TaxID=260084 RepID=A0A1G4PUV0_9CAUL|nr:TonB-dependent receptor [Asticcacaulis taihuensis]SCW36144.1 Outer membrane receptor for ferrienterochelin and colicins [Asticcacaulis taihuensis]